MPDHTISACSQCRQTRFKVMLRFPVNHIKSCAHCLEYAALDLLCFAWALTVAQRKACKSWRQICKLSPS